MSILNAHTVKAMEKLLLKSIKKLGKLNQLLEQFSGDYISPIKPCPYNFKKHGK